MICQFASPVEIVDIHKQPEVLKKRKKKKENTNLICFIFRQLFWKGNIGNGNLMLLPQNIKNGDCFIEVYYKMVSKRDKN